MKAEYEVRSEIFLMVFERGISVEFANAVKWKLFHFGEMFRTQRKRKTRLNGMTL